MQLDCDEAQPWYAIYGRMLAELETQRTRNIAEFFAFTMALSGLVVSITIKRTIWALLMGCGEEKKDALD